MGENVVMKQKAVSHKLETLADNTATQLEMLEKENAEKADHIQVLKNKINDLNSVRIAEFTEKGEKQVKIIIDLKNTISDLNSVIKQQKQDVLENKKLQENNVQNLQNTIKDLRSEIEKKKECVLEKEKEN